MLVRSKLKRTEKRVYQHKEPRRRTTFYVMADLEHSFKLLTHVCLIPLKAPTMFRVT